MMMMMQVVMHTHTPYATALGCLEDPSLLMTHQNSCRCGERASGHVINLRQKLLVLVNY